MIALLPSVADIVLSAECGSIPSKQINLDLWSTKSLSSPDQQWKLVSAGPNTEHKAVLYIERISSSKRWKIGWIERSGTAFWSEDSQRLFLRDEYAADDTKIRVFDVTSPVPKEIKGLNSRMQKTIFAQIPQNKTTLWLYYPQVCFAANDSSTIIVVADAPLVPKKENGSGAPFRVKITVNLITSEIASTIQLPREKSAQ